MQYELFQPEDRFSFFSLSSGSCGNCYYLGNNSYGILIDAGIGTRTIKKRLAENGVEITSIQAVLITHDHLDHIRSIGSLGEKLHIPVYATHKVHKGIENCRLVREKLNGSRRYFEKGKPFHIEDLTITAFDVPHDSIDHNGFFFQFAGQTLALATDVGAITDEIAGYVRKANHLIIESNYDEEMLQTGHYPYILKQRISGGSGHLSNRQTGEFLADIYGGHLRNIWLCHLSADNNRPELAYETIGQCLAQKGITIGEDVALRILKRNTLSQRIELLNS
ncbi:MAG: MBL fold metallo-hydrolase [Dysgonamonadaceae bacterium]|jgi:phosphoribosyl 1,2-cyclic phosphodiesterase|nr:MBL fold metallo-hydrolase [Dysgonamonadaceae bacterium]